MEKLAMKPFALGACLFSGLAATAAAQVPERPNMVLIIADDCPYYDLGCYGAVNNRTPNIDAVFDRMKLKLPPQFVDTEVTREYYARYLAEIGLDKEVGDVVSLLDEKGLRRNTLVVFVSEQGTLFAGAKWTNWSAGVKAGMLASWPGVIEEGVETQAIVQYEDILPTFIELAGGTRPAMRHATALIQPLSPSGIWKRKFTPPKTSGALCSFTDFNAKIGSRFPSPNGWSISSSFNSSMPTSDKSRVRLILTFGEKSISLPYFFIIEERGCLFLIRVVQITMMKLFLLHYWI